MIRFARAWTSPKIDLVLSLIYRDILGIQDYQIHNPLDSILWPTRSDTCLVGFLFGLYLTH